MCYSRMWFLCATLGWLSTDVCSFSICSAALKYDNPFVARLVTLGSARVKAQCIPKPVLIGVFDARRMHPSSIGIISQMTPTPSVSGSLGYHGQVQKKIKSCDIPAFAGGDLAASLHTRGGVSWKRGWVLKRYHRKSRSSRK